MQRQDGHGGRDEYFAILAIAGVVSVIVALVPGDQRPVFAHGGPPKSAPAPSATQKASPSALSSMPLAMLPDVSLVTSPSRRPFGASRPELASKYGNLPLSFERNEGQTDSQVQFLVRGRGYTLFLTEKEAVLTLKQGVKGKGIRGDGISRTQATAGETSDVDPRTSNDVVRMRLEGANLASRTLGLEPLPGIVNYFIGNDPQTWRTNIPTYKKVEYKDIYPGIDLAYYGNEGKLEYDLIVAPGADPNQIKLAFEGAEKIEVDPATGDLVLALQSSENSDLGTQHSALRDGMRGTTLRVQKPLVYQLNEQGHKHLVAGSYVVPASASSNQASGAQDSALNTVTVVLELAAYDHTKSLVIDPVLFFSTYLGGAAADMAQGHRC